MSSDSYKTALRRLDTLDALGGFDSLETLHEILKPESLNPDLRLIATLAMVSADLLSDEQFREAARIAVGEAIMPIAAYAAWDDGGDDGDVLAAMKACQSAARTLTDLASKAG